MATLLITKNSDDTFSFVLDGDFSTTIRNTRNDLTSVGNEAHFKTANGANLVKNQQISPSEVTIVDGGNTYSPTNITQLFTILKNIGYFDWINGGGGSGGVDRFDELDDTFQYFGKDGQVVVVNESQLRLEAREFTNVDSFIELIDAPDAYIPGKYLVVNALGTALIFTDLPLPPTDASKLDSGGYPGTAQDIVDAIDNIEELIVTPTTETVINLSNVPGVNATEALDYLLSKSDINWELIEAISGDTYTIADDTDILSVGEGFVSVYTINLPTITEAKKVTITFNSLIPNLTIGAGGAIDHTPTKAKLYDTWSWVYEPTNNQWIQESYWNGDLGAQIDELSGKTTIVGGDTFAISDSENSNAPKKVTATNLSNFVRTGLELLANKQNSLANDGTGTKYPTVDAVNAVIPVSYSNIIYVNATNPNSATIFDLNNPPVTNDNTLKSDANNLYIGSDASTWVYNSTTLNYVTKVVSSSSSNFFLSGTTTDAGGSKSAAIERTGTVGGAPATASNHFITKSQADAKYLPNNFNQSRWQFSDFLLETLLVPFGGVSIASGTVNGSSYTSALDNNSLGALGLQCSTNANSGYRMYVSSIPPRAGCTFFGRIGLEAATTGRDRLIRIGIHSTPNQIIPVNGIYLEIQGNTASFKCTAVSTASSSASVVLSEATSSAMLYYSVLITFTADRVARCTLYDYTMTNILTANFTSADNMPTIGARMQCGVVATVTTAGTTNMICLIDYMGFGTEKPNFLNNF